MTEHDARRNDAACKVGTVLSFIPPTRRVGLTSTYKRHSQDLTALLLTFYRTNLNSSRCDSTRADAAAPCREPLLI